MPGVGHQRHLPDPVRAQQRMQRLRPVRAVLSRLAHVPPKPAPNGVKSSSVPPPQHRPRELPPGIGPERQPPRAQPVADRQPPIPAIPPSIGLSSRHGRRVIDHRLPGQPGATPRPAQHFRLPPGRHPVIEPCAGLPSRPHHHPRVVERQQIWSLSGEITGQSPRIGPASRRCTICPRCGATDTAAPRPPAPGAHAPAVTTTVSAPIVSPAPRRPRRCRPRDQRRRPLAAPRPTRCAAAAAPRPSAPRRPAPPPDMHRHSGPRAAAETAPAPPPGTARLISPAPGGPAPPAAHLLHRGQLGTVGRHRQRAHAPVAGFPLPELRQRGDQLRIEDSRPPSATRF